MEYIWNPDVYYGRYGEYTYVRNVRDRADYLYNEICFDVLEFIRRTGHCTLDQLVEHLFGMYEEVSRETLSADMQVFFE